MNKADFFRALRKELKSLKKTEIQKNISYYDEMISDMTEHHMTEEEAVSRIGSPKAAAREILSAAAPEQFRKKDPVLIILVLASVLLAAASLYSLCERTIRLSVSLDSSVAIIGGADGPTSIFLAGRIAPPVPLYVITIAVIGAAVIYYIVRRRRK